MPHLELPESPRSHDLERKSVRWVENTLPCEWPSERVRSDYGTDIVVEAFADGCPTGMMLNVQVKGTDHPFPDRQTYSYSAPVKWLNYCLTRPSPVVLVCYFARADKALWLWVKDYVHLVLDLTKPDWQGQKTVTLRIPTRRVFAARSKGEILAHMYSHGWEALMDHYVSLLEAASPRREQDVLRLSLPHVDEAELEHLLSVFPDQVSDRVRRCHAIVAKGRDQMPVTIDDGQYAGKHLPRLAFWAGQRRAELSQCLSNLRQLCLAAGQHQQDKGVLPSTADWRTQLLPYVRNETVFHCPSTQGGGYALNPAVAGRAGLPSDGLPLFVDASVSAPETGFAPDCRHLGGCCVCMTDGSARWLLPDELLSLGTRLGHD